jgi:hypothetical protein
MPGAAVSPATGPINCVRLQKVASELDIVGDLKVRPTWNSGSETFNALQIEVTDTNSQIASKVIDAKVAGSSVFSVDKGGNIVAAGDLQVLGDLTTISSTNLTILDKEVVLASNQSTDANVNGAGIKLGTTTKGFTYNYNSGVNPRWDLSDGLNLTGTQGLYMAGSSILSSTTLGSSVVNSSLESVGVLEGLSVDGLSILKTISEDIVALSGATGTVNHDFGSSAVFYHTGINANFTCNLIGVPTTQNKAYSIALILNQGATGRIPNSFAVNSGTPITINWSNGATPVANANKIDIVAFSLVNVAGTFVVYGQLSSFG